MMPLQVDSKSDTRDINGLALFPTLHTQQSLKDDSICLCILFPKSPQQLRRLDLSSHYTETAGGDILKDSVNKQIF